MIRIKPFVILALGCLVLSSCGTYGDHFFVRNYEEKPVQLQFRYHPHDNITEGPGFAFTPNSYVMLSAQVVEKKVMRNYPYKFKDQFDTLKIEQLDSLTYQVALPAKSTVYIAPVYRYGDNIGEIILEGSYTINFVPGWPGIKQEQLRYHKIYRVKGPFFSNKYKVLDVKLDEIKQFSD